MDNTLSLLYFPSAVILGGLHALEPGHAKTLTAAYLIGTKGTKRDAILLGISVAATHSIVVVALSAFALYFGKETFTDNAAHWMQLISGSVVIFAGVRGCFGSAGRERRLHQNKTMRLMALPRRCI